MTAIGKQRPTHDPLHGPGGPDEHWSTDNVGEAMPGVLSPLGASVWDLVANNMLTSVAYGLGVFSLAERDSAHHWFRVFYGRGALQVEFMAIIGDRVPGTSGEEAVKSLFGRAPESMQWAPTKRRYPFVAAKLPIVFLGSPRKIMTLAPQTDLWWRDQITRIQTHSLSESQAVFREASRRFKDALFLQSIGLIGCIQPLYETLQKVVDSSGVGDVGVLSGSGGAEMAIVGDIWKVSRGQMTIDQVTANHGFHGPREGDLCAHVWREDPTPLERVVGEYAAKDESASPLARESETARRRAVMQREVAATFPRAQRPAMEGLLRFAAKRIPLRGVAKRSFLQSLDVARAAARRAGEHLSTAGVLEDPEDVFYLTSGELTGAMPSDIRELVAGRRAQRAEYEQLVLPSNWKGTPIPIEETEPVEAGPRAGDHTRVSGLGVSPGVVEGTVRVVTDPAFADVEPGDILVSTTTDPSWSSIMFISSALVVDIGSALSHAAVVARELGVPCVVNTQTGSRTLRTGDRVRVDGTKGTVEVIEPA